jgi:hypothetical protein
MANNFSFDACRSCVKSPADAELIDLFDHNGENARKVEEIARIDVRSSKTFIVDIQNSSNFSLDVCRQEQAQRIDVQGLLGESLHRC